MNNRTTQTHGGPDCLWLGMISGDVRHQPDASPASQEERTIAEASPITRVSADSPPFLLIHGEQDDIVPIA